MKIALKGYARTGKDTIFEIIRTNYGLNTRRLAFGDDLRRHFHNTFPDIPEYPKPREGYEIYGKAMRDVDINVWVKHTAKRYNRLLQMGYEDFVITDLRQPHEYTWARQNGFIIVEVRSTEYLREERSGKDTSWMPVTPSEVGMAGLHPDFVINNNGTLDDLEREVRRLLRNIKKMEDTTT